MKKYLIILIISLCTVLMMMPASILGEGNDKASTHDAEVQQIVERWEKNFSNQSGWVLPNNALSESGFGLPTETELQQSDALVVAMQATMEASNSTPDIFKPYRPVFSFMDNDEGRFWSISFMSIEVPSDFAPIVVRIDPIAGKAIDVTFGSHTGEPKVVTLNQK